MAENKLLTVITWQEIKAAIVKKADEYTKIYDGVQLTIVAELESTFMFVSDFIRELPIDVQIRFVSYPTDSRKDFDIELGKYEALTGRHVLIMNDMLYKGKGLKKIYDKIKSEDPADIRVLTLLEKPTTKRVTKFNVESLFQVHNEHVLGYGLTYNGSYRGLKSIYKVVEETSK
ncbi:phosphoribosyltransferase [Spiroplasma endosymbiont of Othius punctulatus]|uniref:phosphoribosyltransferase n=1 Tax=Spiroplasma endosymbiont of Othius punctulatus TaxID=3066289 RepID=UPI0030D59B59